MRVQNQEANLNLGLSHPLELLKGLKNIAINKGSPITVTLLDAGSRWAFGSPQGNSNFKIFNIIEITDQGLFFFWVKDFSVQIDSSFFESVKEYSSEKCELYFYNQEISYKNAYLKEINNPTPGAKYYGFFKDYDKANASMERAQRDLKDCLLPSDSIWIEEVIFDPNKHPCFTKELIIPELDMPRVTSPSIFFILVIGTNSFSKKDYSQKIRSIKIKDL